MMLFKKAAGSQWNQTIRNAILHASREGELPYS
jgi:hypothetical protein